MSETLKRNDQLGKYKLVKWVGRGNYAEVWKASQIDGGKPVAIKVLHSGIGEKHKKLLANEAWIQKKLIHKNIVQCLDYCTDDERCDYLVLEFVNGYSFHDIITQKVAQKISMYKAIAIINSCLRALYFAHMQITPGVVHGDIKPGNILITKGAEEAKISDFGVARTLGTRQSMFKANGSSPYAAPEVLTEWESEKHWDPDYQSDLFSLGQVAYHILTGRHPFSDYTGLGRPMNKLIEDPNFRPPELVRLDGAKIHPKYASVIMKLLQKDKSERYQSAKEVLDDIRKANEHSRCRNWLDRVRAHSRSVNASLSPGRNDLPWIVGGGEICGNCGFHVQGEANYCPECGTPLNPVKGHHESTEICTDL